MLVLAQVFLGQLFRPWLMGTEVLRGQTISLADSYIAGAILLGDCTLYRHGHAPALCPFGSMVAPTESFACPLADNCVFGADLCWTSPCVWSVFTAMDIMAQGQGLARASIFSLINPPGNHRSFNDVIFTALI